MKNPKEMRCDECGETKTRREIGRKISGLYLCKSCKVTRRKQHREETIDSQGIRDELKTLHNKLRRNYYTPRIKVPKDNNFEPEIKGSKFGKRKEKNSCYLSLEEKQILLKLLLKRGMDFEDAKERISILIKSQGTLKEKMIMKNASEELIKQKQAELLEELWNE